MTGSLTALDEFMSHLLVSSGVDSATIQIVDDKLELRIKSARRMSPPVLRRGSSIGDSSPRTKWDKIKYYKRQSSAPLNLPNRTVLSPSTPDSDGTDGSTAKRKKFLPQLSKPNQNALKAPNLSEWEETGVPLDELAKHARRKRRQEDRCASSSSRRLKAQ